MVVRILTKQCANSSTKNDHELQYDIECAPMQATVVHELNNANRCINVHNCHSCSKYQHSAKTINH